MAVYVSRHAHLKLVGAPTPDRVVNFGKDNPPGQFETDNGTLISWLESHPQFGVLFFKDTIPDPIEVGRIQFPDAPITYELSKEYVNLRGLSAAEFGAKGDGSTDDTGALQRLFSSVNHEAIIFVPGATYRITQPLTLDVAKVRGIVGNNATLLLDVNDDSPAIDMVGSKTNGSANPSIGENRALSIPEFTPFIHGLKIASYNESYNGTGIRIKGTFGVNISHCHIFNLAAGIEFVDINRNIIISDNVIWNCGEYGIWWNKGDTHQVNIVGNHISYCKRLIYLDDPELHNLQIVGNDLEINTGTAFSGNPVSIFEVNAPTKAIESIVIANNTIEDHVTCTSPLIVVNATNLTSVIIEGNLIGGAANGCIYIKGGSLYSINGNNFRSNRGTIIAREATGVFRRMNILNNIGDNWSDRFLHIYPADGSASEVRGMLFSNNHVWCRTFSADALVEFESTRMHDVIIRGNYFEVSGAGGSGTLLKVTNPSHTSGVVINENIFRADSAHRAVDVTVSGNVSKSVMRDNYSYGMQDPTPFIVPENFVTENNEQ